MSIDLKTLAHVLAYDEESGVFRWKTSRRRVRAGQIAGTQSTKGYWQIKVFQKVIEAHRLAWLFVHGEWPASEVDHINCDKMDNRIANLRLAGRSQNCANSRRRARNKTGYKGVVYRGQKFAAQITVAKKVVSLGVYDKAEDAHAAYVRAARRAHGDFARCA